MMAQHRMLIGQLFLIFVVCVVVVGGGQYLYSTDKHSGPAHAVV